MINNYSFYKSTDLTSDNIRNNLFNPYEYNIESNKKDIVNTDKMCMKSKNHQRIKFKK